MKKVKSSHLPFFILSLFLIAAMVVCNFLDKYERARSTKGRGNVQEISRDLESSYNRIQKIPY